MAKFTDYVGKAWNLYWANFFQIFLAMLLILAISFILILVMGFAMEMDALTGIILLAAVLLVLIPLGASFFGMTAEAVKTGKTSIGTLFSTFKQKAVTLLGIEIAGAVVTMLPLIVAFVAVLGVSAVSSSLDIFSLIVIIVAALASVALSILLLLAVPSAVCDNTGVVQSLKNSFAVAKANLGSIFVLWLAYSVLSVVLSFIPIVGSIIVLFLISPMMDIAITDFYMQNRAKPAGAVAKPAPEISPEAPKPRPKPAAKTAKKPAKKAAKTRAKTKA